MAILYWSIEQQYSNSLWTETTWWCFKIKAWSQWKSYKSDSHIDSIIKTVYSNAATCFHDTKLNIEATISLYFYINRFDSLLLQCFECGQSMVRYSHVSYPMWIWYTCLPSSSVLVYVSGSGSKDGRLILWFTAEWSKMNVIEVDMNSSIICMDVSVDSTFLVAGKQTTKWKNLNNFYCMFFPKLM